MLIELQFFPTEKKKYVMDKLSRWEGYLYLVKFTYNNGYHVSLKMSLFEALYGRKCNTLVSWDNPIDKVIIGPEILKDMEEKMVRIRKKLKIAHNK